MAASRSSVVANGVRFGIIEEGTGPLVLLVHGFPDTAHTWDEVRPVVAAAGFRAVCPFTRGYAPTEVPADKRYDLDALGADVVALISALGEKQAILVGHDWGAGATYAAAAMAPAQVRLLVTVAIPHTASVRPTLGLAWLGRHFVTLRLPGAVARAAKNNFAHIDELVQRWSPTWKVPAGETDRVKESFRRPGSLDAALGYYRAVRIPPPKWAMAKISVPTIAFHGTDDGLTLEDFTRAGRWFTGGYRVVEMSGGHFLHREFPAEFNAKLLEALETAPSLHTQPA